MLDKLNEVCQKLEQVARTPDLNWWDVLPANVPRPMVGFVHHFNPINCQDPTQRYVFKCQVMEDRFELWLELNAGWVVWRRAIFFNPPFGGKS